ncbi:MAG TPA: PQQ-binding-like beta-propeller repeat protein, partial [Nitrososphaera sp.]|nr:PQQ-binding-like beta-propeller repeat protein [Nitrososphaera sp.]
DFPTWVSPAVSNGVVFSGHVTAPGKPYEYGDFGAPTETPLLPSGIVIALDKDTGKQLWEFNVGAPIGIGGPSIGHGMLFVTTGSPAEMGSNKGGYIVAFGLPDNGTGTSSISVNENQSGTGSTGNTTMTPSATNTTSVTGNNATSQSGAATESARPTPADKVASNNTQQQQQQQQKGMAMNATTGNKATGTKTYGGSANSNG